MKPNQKSLPILFFYWFLAAQPARILAHAHEGILWVWHYFSIGFLAPRLFSPWHRDITSYGRGFDLRRSLHALGWNLISRVIGAVLRIVLIATGFAMELCVLGGAMLLLVLWYALPIIILLGAIGKISITVLQ